MRKLITSALLALVLFTGSSALSGTHYTGPRNQRPGNPAVVVWLNPDSRVYHCPGTRWYGRTKRGRHASQRSARAAGYRPAFGAVCG